MTEEQYQKAKPIMDQISQAKTNLDRLRKAQSSKAALNFSDNNGTFFQCMGDQARAVLQTAIEMEVAVLQNLEIDLRHI